MSLVKLEGVSLAQDRKTILRDVTMSIEPEQIVTIVGPNGSGKTTLLRGIIGALRASAGKITKKPGLKIGYVPQKLHLDRNLPMTVKRFLRLSMPAREITGALEAVNAAALIDRQMTNLSGGQFQRVLLAAALQSKPDLLLLDEPTQGLDQPGTAQFYAMIEEARQKLGCAVVMVSHDLHVVMSASDQVICVNGHICCQGPPKQVASAPEYRALFGTETGGTFALYQHAHDHGHSH